MSDRNHPNFAGNDGFCSNRDITFGGTAVDTQPEKAIDESEYIRKEATL